MKVTRSRINHVEMYVGRGKVINGLVNRAFIDYEKLMDMKNQVLVVLRADLSPIQKKKLHRVVDEVLKSKPRYNLRGLVGHAIYRATGFFPRWLNRTGRFFCSELVYECYLKAGFKLGEHEHSEFVSPTDMFESDKLQMIFLLDGINGIKLSRKTRDSNKKIKRETKKLLLKKIK
ncbi:hypothetical protein GOV14_06455 [Candidatus Pacearchaeota archaeon]|nr:hypothetical protein [Candidatus Pacearchaeota archaeon]